MLSTLPIEIVNVIRNTSQRITTNGITEKHYERISVQAPSCVSVYNMKMGAVDLVGYFTSMIHYNFQCKKWTHHVSKLFFYIFKFICVFIYYIGHFIISFNCCVKCS